MAKKAKKTASNPKTALLAILAIGYGTNTGRVHVGISTEDTCGTVNSKQAISNLEDEAEANEVESVILDRLIEVRGTEVKKDAKKKVPTKVVQL